MSSGLSALLCNELENEMEHDLLILVIESSVMMPEIPPGDFRLLYMTGKWVHVFCVFDSHWRPVHEFEVGTCLLFQRASSVVKQLVALCA